MTAVTSYEQALQYLFGRLNYERVQPASYSAREFKLDRMKRLLAHLGDPQERIPAVHIAGTKGKGSTAAMAAEMLQAAGYRVGLFTSPHISDYEERMTVDGAGPNPQQLVELVNRLAPAVNRLDKSPGAMSPTFFEVTTAMAWLYFAAAQVQLAVLEVGLGGRLDATNLCRPEVCLITNISRDHTALLGNTHARIAREKAGIVKAGVPLVSGVLEADPRRVIETVCRERAAPLVQLGREIAYTYHAGPQPRQQKQPDSIVPAAAADVVTPSAKWPNVPIPLAGEHQAANAALAIGGLSVLRERGWAIPQRSVYAGMANVKWPLRIEVLSRQPTVVLDVAHNCASMAALLKTVNAVFRADRRVLVFAASRDKDVHGLLSLAMPQFDSVILTQFQQNPRAMPVERLQKAAHGVPGAAVHTAADPMRAWRLAAALTGDNDLLCVAGSFFLAAEIRPQIVEELKRALPADAALHAHPGRQPAACAPRTA